MSVHTKAVRPTETDLDITEKTLKSMVDYCVDQSRQSLDDRDCVEYYHLTYFAGNLVKGLDALRNVRSDF